jgi:hypothetical protein
LRLTRLAMAASLATGLLVAASSAPASAATRHPRRSLGVGQTLWAGGRLRSPDHRSRAVLRPDGNLIVVGADGGVWWTHTAGHPDASLTLQTDGNLVLYSHRHRALWNSGTEGRHPTQLTLTDSGQLRLSRGSTTIWLSPLPVIPCYPHSTPLDRLSPGQTVGLGTSFMSPSGQGAVGVFMCEGNLQSQMYDPGSRTESVLWDSGSANEGGTRLVFQQDGNVVIYAGNRAIWSTGTEGTGATSFGMDPWGNFSVKAGDRTVWSSYQLQPGQRLPVSDGFLSCNLQSSPPTITYYINFSDGSTLNSTPEYYTGSGVYDTTILISGEIITDQSGTRTYTYDLPDALVLHLDFTNPANSTCSTYPVH